ncbi:conserved hypothetical protein [Cellulomonas flavigena DSM 20109]|uniref:Uncharacterized protein n=1 Tax=Cellulomonas flavigena (strain ATCC 482 / DSM 20109 / BCRC 11376 / JCM 18109 / NBRC 3775 / NCIMB 8073 / NRS 134) TaxID=446466 RepID=D5ULF0_CELFN|nr:hypothetical protein [Cellulomonas flavigena]ADG73992.1 conserved hypothetical protein [Cellulomonas flavigena DSM 20109]
MTSQPPVPGGPTDGPAPQDPQAARWRAERREAAAAHAAALAARQHAESTRARAMIAEFLEAARARGVAPVALHVRSYDGRSRYRTPLAGWYLRRDETVGVDTAGEFYVLTAPSSLVSRLRGVHPTPQDPPLVIGAGGKDGESIDMRDALARVLSGEV